MNSSSVQISDAQRGDGDIYSRTLGQPADLPTWPVAATFAGFPLWWLLGIVDFIWIPIAGIMILYMWLRGAIRVPQSFGVWLLFLVWAGCAIIGLSHSMQLIGFGYRLGNYIACTVLFLYVYNARTSLTDRFITGTLTVWWLIVVAGGFIALLLPTARLRTPLSFVVPGSLLSNEWVNLMVIRPLNQYDPDSYFQLAPRPSAPFVYTNQWGSVYSLLLPIVAAYLIQVRGTRRFWLISAALVISFIPAILTTNRGMLLGIGVGAVYAAGRMLLRRDLRGVSALAVVGIVGVVVFRLLPVSNRLESRSESPSITDRGWLYSQSVEAVKDSPLFGYGRTLTVPDAVDPVGTQGEFWIVLVSYGFGAAILFLSWFLLAYTRSLSWHDPVGLAANTVLLITVFEFFFYGAVPHSLPVSMIAAALALRTRDPLLIRNRVRSVRSGSGPWEQPS